MEEQPPLAPIDQLDPDLGLRLRLRKSVFDDAQKDLRHRSSYLVIAQDVFFPALFFQIQAELRPQFRFLTTPKCLADLVAAGHTDVNVADGRFWEAMGIREETLYDRGLWWHDARTEVDIRAWGHTVESLFAKVHPKRCPVPSAMVPFLGQLLLRRDSLPNVKRSQTFSAISDLFQEYTSYHFGIAPTDQSLSHLPISVSEGRLRVNLLQPG